MAGTIPVAAIIPVTATIPVAGTPRPGYGAEGSVLIFSIMGSPRVFLLGVPLDAVTRDQAVARLRALLDSPAQHHVMTPNSEMLVESTHNARFREIMLQSTLNLPDSAGVLWMARYTGQRLPQRVAGVDAVMELCAGLGSDHPVFLLGAADGVAAKAADALRAMNPRLRVAGSYGGSPRPDDFEGIAARINAAAPHLLLVAFGAPAQDLWIAEHLGALPSVRVAMGVGGTFDFLAGTQVRAPAFLRSLGLEWAWRFAHEPWRWRRMWRAVIVFPFLVLRHGRQ